MKNKGIQKVFLFFLVMSSLSCAMLESSLQEESVLKDPFAVYERAVDYHTRGQYEKAKTLFHQYIAEEQQSSLMHIALYYLAHCYQMTQDVKQAELLYHRVMSEAQEDDFWTDMASTRISQIKANEQLK